MGIRLNDVITSNISKKTKVMEFDKGYGVSFELVFLTKPELNQILVKHTKMQFNPVTHQKEEVLDNEGFTQEILSKCVSGWKGVNWEWVSTQIIIDKEKIVDLKEELEFNQDNLKTLAKYAYGFENWVIDTIRNASNFSEKKELEIKN